MDASPCAHHDSAPAVSDETVQAALQHAASVSAQEGEKWTPPRKRVYELLLRAGGPVKAYDLMPAYSEDRAVKPPTVYRALDFLVQLGVVHRIPSLNAYTACRSGGETHTASFLICECCGSAEEIHPNLKPAITKASAERRFKPSSATLEVRGLCERCSA